MAGAPPAPLTGPAMANFLQITPFMHVPDIDEAVRFFEEVLGFATGFRMDDYAYVEREGVAHPHPPESWRGRRPPGNRRFAYYVDVRDVDALHAELKPKLDALPPGDVHGPADKPYRQRELADRRAGRQPHRLRPGDRGELMRFEGQDGLDHRRLVGDRRGAGRGVRGRGRGADPVRAPARGARGAIAGDDIWCCRSRRPTGRAARRGRGRLGLARRRRHPRQQCRDQPAQPRHRHRAGGLPDADRDRSARADLPDPARAAADGGARAAAISSRSARSPGGSGRCCGPAMPPPSTA